MLEIKVTIEAKEIADAINNLANALTASRFSTPAFTDEINSSKGTKTKKAEKTPAKEPVKEKEVPAPPPTASVPLASAPQYTIDQIMKAGAALMDAGKINELRKLIDSFGVEAVTNLKPEQLGAFATELRKLGAKI